VYVLQEKVGHVSYAYHLASCSRTSPSHILHSYRFFHRYGRGQGPDSQTCCSCRRYRGSDWSGGQAEKALRLKGLSRTLHTRYTAAREANTGWCKGTRLYSDETVTRAAVEGYERSVWELHYGLAMYEKRRRKKPDDSLDSDW